MFDLIEISACTLHFLLLTYTWFHSYYYCPHLLVARAHNVETYSCTLDWILAEIMPALFEKNKPLVLAIAMLRHKMFTWPKGFFLLTRLKGKKTCTVFTSSNVLIFGLSSVSLLVTQERTVHWLEGRCSLWPVPYWLVRWCHPEPRWNWVWCN